MFDVSVTLRAHGSATVEEAWDRYATIARWPQWSPQIRRVDADARRLAPGVTGLVFGPAGLRVPFEVLDVDEVGRGWSWRVQVGPFKVWLHHRVTSTSRGAETFLRLRGPAPLVAAYAPLAQLALYRLVRR